MAHFAQLDENNIVVQVVVVDNQDITNSDGQEIEALGVALCERVVGPGPWVQTSYNNNLRRRYARAGDTYLPDDDVFIEPKPAEHPSWVLNDNHDWSPPIEKPGEDYWWDETALQWKPSTGEFIPPDSGQ